MSTPVNIKSVTDIQAEYEKLFEEYQSKIETISNSRNNTVALSNTIKNYTNVLEVYQSSFSETVTHVIKQLTTKDNANNRLEELKSTNFALKNFYRCVLAVCAVALILVAVLSLPVSLSFSLSGNVVGAGLSSLIGIAAGALAVVAIKTFQKLTKEVEERDQISNVDLDLLISQAEYQLEMSVSRCKMLFEKIDALNLSTTV